jgi:hypothetical protein
MAAAREGYVFHSYGADRYAKHAVVSVQTLRRHDPDRPTALFCPPSHQELLDRTNLADTFDVLETLPEEHRSIVGFKHHLHRFKPFERSLFVDADMIWCRDPDPLWQQFAAFPFTATGLQNADHFFGGPKGLGVFVDMLLRRRKRTLRRFGLTSLPRVQAGMIYAQDDAVTHDVCTRAAEFLAQSDETHFRSRLDEGRSEETCEWSLALAMREFDLHVFPWLQGRNSPQLDYIGALVDHDLDFENVTYRFYTSPFVYELRGIPNETLLDTLLRVAEQMPRMGEYVEFTPYVLHFGWLHQKPPFYDFAERVWDRLMDKQEIPKPVEGAGA